MSYLIISDIHGCTNNLNIALASPHDFQQIIFLGDYMYHGPRNPILPDYNPSEVASILNKLDSPIAVRGNCDSEVDQMLLDFDMFDDYKLINDYNKSIFITHGHIYDPSHDASKLEHDIFISGHTHLPRIEQMDFGIILNPGSISMPKGGHPATYAILDENAITIYTTDHEIYMQYNF